MISRFLIALFALVVSLGSVQAQGNYLIKSGDTLSIEILEDTSLNRQVLVLPDGRVSFPMAGPLTVGGRTTEQVERAISSRIANNFSVAPTVYVSVAGISQSQSEPASPAIIKIYLVGEVNAPGAKELAPGTTLLQALSESGGFTKYAATKRVQLRRTMSDGRQRLIKINYKAISQGAVMSNDPSLRDGDVILVPERRLFE
ncbi:polysaccharide biosynthesis/export family protein [Tropicimonas sp. TH_r6]|uniref:polysaccharide biosynthesis/export family protein n=1 Tax=Tropicimonas sp. TH_r6 TaxID=3082085 RepID=UPI0029540283|nr:polysaccharide biosynthesis/export family protein [Tropicimonas sp. TH_r6]MDV7145558.1 polysaccharide biosynthesis/export family protein [Tropicimonas sp. TH_r6]